MPTSTQRSQLLKAVNLLKPALGSDYIPALTHIKFDGEFATAYNDVSAIVVECKTEFKRCVPGDLLGKALASQKGESVALTYDEKTSVLLVASGRSKIKLPTLPLSDFPFEVDSSTAPEVVFTKEMIDAMGMCLMSVGKDDKQPKTMGVTMERDADGAALFYSTDSTTLSRAATKSAITLPGDSPVILPTFFCEQLRTLAKEFGGEAVLVMLPGALLVDFFKDGATRASIFTRTLIDLEPLDFTKVTKRLLKGQDAKMVPIPDAFDAAFGRALLVLSGEVNKVTHVQVDETGLTITSTSTMGESEDDIDVEGLVPMSFKVDPALVVRGTKQASEVACLRDALIFGDGKHFVHFVSHVS